MPANSQNSVSGIPVRHPSQLPAVDRIIEHQSFAPLLASYGRETVVSEIRCQLQKIRNILTTDTTKHGGKPAQPESAAKEKSQVFEFLHKEVNESLSQTFTPSLQRVFNLAGTVLHTNLGRAPYPQAAIDAMVEVSSGACNLEYNLTTGKRGRRDDHVEKWICKLTGAEAATTVNNNAAAVLLTLNSIAKDRKVIVSRGELIEIGGSFRIPAIMTKAGCKLKEVGTTNRTHYQDYEAAIGKKTAALMKVHTSNYEINGFTKSVSAKELASLAKEKNIPLLDDLGSGTLIDMTRFGLPYERTANDAIKDGADLITFSGDKLLGGPQCGVIAGRKDLIDLIDQNPMKRAMRLDKVTIAALEAVLRLYCNPDELGKTVPSLQLLAMNGSEIRSVATSVQSVLSKLLPKHQVTVEDAESQIGSGALPTDTLASAAVVVRETSETPADTLAQHFRSLSTPVIGRVAQDALWLDCRLLASEANALITMLNRELVE